MRINIQNVFYNDKKVDADLFNKFYDGNLENAELVAILCELVEECGDSFQDILDEIESEEF